MSKIIIFYEHHNDKHPSHAIFALFTQLQKERKLGNIIFCLEEDKNIINPIKHYTVDLQRIFTDKSNKINAVLKGLAQEIKKGEGIFFIKATHILASCSYSFGILDRTTGKPLTLDQYKSMDASLVYKLLTQIHQAVLDNLEVNLLASNFLTLLIKGGGSVSCIDLDAASRGTSLPEGMDKRNRHFVDQIQSIRALNKDSTIIFLVGRSHSPVGCMLKKKGYDICEYYIHDKRMMHSVTAEMKCDETGDINTITFDEEKNIYLSKRRMFKNSTEIANFIMQNELLPLLGALSEITSSREIQQQRAKQQQFQLACCTSVLSAGVFIAAYCTASTTLAYCALATSTALLLYAYKEEIKSTIDYAYSRVATFVETSSPQRHVINDNTVTLCR